MAYREGMEESAALFLARREAEALVADLCQEMMAIAEATGGSPDDEHDSEGSTLGFERARVAALLANAQHSLALIDLALARQRAGTFGTCRNCGVPIPSERLEAIPTAETCFGCALRAPR